MRHVVLSVALLAMSGGACAQGVAPPAAPAPPQAAPQAQASPEPWRDMPYEPHVVELMRAEAARLMPQLKCLSARQFLLATSFLLFPEDRVIYWDAKSREALTPAEFEALPAEARGRFEAMTLTPRDYYYTRYGSPLAYARAIEIACDYFPGRWAFQGRRVLDFGYGTIGHLRLLASIGVHAVGVDVDPRLRALYSDPEDTGVIPGIVVMQEPPPDGTLTLVHGRWPAEAKAKGEVGEGYDLILSKNTLKKGYITPGREVDPRMLVDLGVTPEEFVRAVAGALKPGGIFLIYNLSPAPKSDPAQWVPWADGRCPFPREMLREAGLEVLAFDVPDDEAARAMGRALEWDRGPQPMDLEGDLFALYTVVRKPAAGAPATGAGPRPAAP